MANPQPDEMVPDPKPKKQQDPSWSVSYPGGGSQSTSSSSSYDYGGQDLVHKVGDDLSQANAAKFSALYNGDISGALATGRRIADLSGYINAYKASGGAGGFYNGVFGEVVPRTRLSNQSSSQSYSNESGGSQAHGGRVLQLD
jgi:hypothetical protein